MKRWTLAQIGFLGVVTMCAATIAVVSVGFTKQIGANQRAIRHLCALTKVTRAVFASAADSYAGLPSRTVGQARLLVVLRRGVREIDTDRSCPHA